MRVVSGPGRVLAQTTYTETLNTDLWLQTDHAEQAVTGADRLWTSYCTKSCGTSHLCDCAELPQRPAVNQRQSNWPLPPFERSGLVNASTTFAFTGGGNSCWRYGNISGMKCSERRVRANWSGSSQEWARPIGGRAPGPGNTATIRGEGRTASERDGTRAQQRSRQLSVNGVWLIYPPQCQKFESLSLV